MWPGAHQGTRSKALDDVGGVAGHGMKQFHDPWRNILRIGLLYMLLHLELFPSLKIHSMNTHNQSTSHDCTSLLPPPLPPPPLTPSALLFKTPIAICFPLEAPVLARLKNKRKKRVAPDHLLYKFLTPFPHLTIQKLFFLLTRGVWEKLEILSWCVRRNGWLYLLVWKVLISIRLLERMYVYRDGWK